MHSNYTAARATLLLLALSLAVPSLALAVTPGDRRGALSFTPSGASLVVHAPSIADLVSRAGLPKLIEKHKALFVEVRAEAEREVGADPLTVAGWSQLGIDLAKPVTLALIGPTREAFVFWAPISDRTRLEATLRRLVGQDLSTRQVGDVTVFAAEHGPVRFLMREGWAAIVAVDSGSARAEYAEELATQVATLGPDAAVTASPQWPQIESTLQGNDVAVWLNVRQIAENILAEDKRWREQAKHEETAAKALVEAAERGGAEEPDPAPGPDADEEAARDEAARAAAMRAHEERVEAFVERLTGGVGGISLGARLQGPTLVLEGQLLLDEGHVLRSLLKPGTRMALLQAVSDAPLGLLEASFDGAQLAPLIKEVLGLLDRKDYEHMRGLVQAAFGIDLDQDVLARIGGSFGMSFAMKGETLNAAFTVGVSDEGAVKSVLDRMAASEGMDGAMQEAHQGDVWAWTVPWSENKARIRLGGGQLALSNEPPLADRIADGKVGTWLAKNPASAWLSGEGVALLGALDLGQIVLASAKSYGESRQSESPIEPDASPSLKKLHKTLAAIEAERAKLQAKEAQSRRTLVVQVARLIGPTSLAVTPSPAGFALKGGHVTGAKSVEAAIDGLMAAAAKAQKEEEVHRERSAALTKKQEAAFQAYEKATRQD